MYLPRGCLPASLDHDPTVGGSGEQRLDRVAAMPLARVGGTVEDRDAVPRPTPGGDARDPPRFDQIQRDVDRVIDPHRVDHSGHRGRRG
jgi:hypothetical protein